MNALKDKIGKATSILGVLILIGTMLYYGFDLLDGNDKEEINVLNKINNALNMLNDTNKEGFNTNDLNLKELISTNEHSNNILGLILDKPTANKIKSMKKDKYAKREIISNTNVKNTPKKHSILEVDILRRGEINENSEVAFSEYPNTLYKNQYSTIEYENEKPFINATNKDGSIEENKIAICSLGKDFKEMEQKVNQLETDFELLKSGVANNSSEIFENKLMHADIKKDLEQAINKTLIVEQDVKEIGEITNANIQRITDLRTKTEEKFNSLHVNMLTETIDRIVDDSVEKAINNLEDEEGDDEMDDDTEDDDEDDETEDDDDDE